MGRIFWQFFVAIWFTMLGALAFIVIANSYLKVLPPKGPIRESQQRLATETISLLLKSGSIEAAQTYVEALTQLREPTLMKIAPAQEMLSADTCKARSASSTMVFDERNQRCYVIAAMDPPLTFLETYTPAVLPPLAVFLTSVTSTFLLTRYLARPVIALRSGLSALAAGNFGIRVGFRSGWWNDGITALGHDFDATAAKLGVLQESQRRLFHDVSHELRSPLSRMQAALGLVRQNPGKTDAALVRIEREIERLDGLVEEILTLARLGAPDQFNLERQTVDILDLVAVIVDDAAFEAQARNIRIDFESSDSFVTEVNGELIYRAVENVIRNAVKYSHDDTVITVRSDVSDGSVLTISIHNEGPQVQPEDVERLFEPFTRFNESETVSGHGLGLAITRRAIEAHSGHVRAEGNPEGGLTVRLELPKDSGARGKTA